MNAVTTVPLACTVRGCGRALTRANTAWTCDAGHAFDISRKGYVNLLQPQDRRSTAAGDTRAAVEARAHLLASGIGRGAINACAALVSAFPHGPDAVVVELGCGGGDVLSTIAHGRGELAIGIDLSVDAIGRAAAHHPGHLWVVANADRRLPLLDHSTDLVVSYHGRRNPAECRRILRPEGTLIVAVPAANDLVELREQLGGRAELQDRLEALVEEHRADFSVTATHHVEARHALSRDQVQWLMTGTYRGARHRAAAAVEHLDHLVVTVASDICVFSPIAPPADTAASASR
jgi:SAM-dependent methyltransferase